MSIEEQKIIMVLDETLPLGIMANTSAILGMSLGKLIPEVIGADLVDQSGNQHLGITAIPIPIVKASATKLKEIRAQLFKDDYRDLRVIDFSEIAGTTHDYQQYTKKTNEALEEQIAYYGIAISGRKKLVNKLTGSLPLLR